MKEVRYFYVPDVKITSQLPEEEALHAIRVLRLKPGDSIYLMDGIGSFYEAVVTITSKKQCQYNVLQELPQTKSWNGRIHLAIAPTKNIDRIEWLVEKITEIGVDEITFLNCKFSERTTIRIDRLEKIVISAVKQSRKPWKPIINELTSFDDFIASNVSSNKFIAHCYEEFEQQDFFAVLNKLEDTNITVLVGPEGDFSVEEVQSAINEGYVPISLGKSRLRTETAGLVAVHTSQLVFSKK